MGWNTENITVLFFAILVWKYECIIDNISTQNLYIYILAKGFSSCTAGGLPCHHTLYPVTSNTVTKWDSKNYSRNQHIYSYILTQLLNIENTSQSVTKLNQDNYIFWNKRNLSKVDADIGFPNFKIGNLRSISSYTLPKLSILMKETKEQTDTWHTFSDIRRCVILAGLWIPLVSSHTDVTGYCITILNASITSFLICPLLLAEGHVDLLCQLHGHNATTHYGKLVEQSQSNCYIYFTKIKPNDEKPD